MSKVITYENFLERSKDYRNPNVEIVGKYTGITKPILCKCKIEIEMVKIALHIYNFSGIINFTTFLESFKIPLL